MDSSLRQEILALVHLGFQREYTAGELTDILMAGISEFQTSNNRKDSYMVTKSINAWLSMKNSLQARLAELREMKGNASTRHTSRYDGKEDVTEPTYDIVQIDTKCSLITRALFSIDEAIKEKNASTKMDLDVDYDMLVSPIK